ncbi:MAG: DUF3417 domain-containing protein [Candidatus Acidiferrum sp.]
MSKQTRVSHPIYSLLPTDVEGFDSLAGLALDMRWSWNHATDGVWRTLDPALWGLTQNPWVVLQTVSRERLERALGDPAFRKNVDDLLRARRQASDAPAWFQQTYPQAPLTCVAYFSMEFMLSEALPIYLGGLGNVAGDQLKSASVQGLPVTGVADGINGGDPVRIEMKCTPPHSDDSHRCVYRAAASTARPSNDYTTRVLPHRSGVAVPLESARILWQR